MFFQCNSGGKKVLFTFAAKVKGVAFRKVSWGSAPNIPFLSQFPATLSSQVTLATMPLLATEY